MLNAVEHREKACAKLRDAIMLGAATSQGWGPPDGEQRMQSLLEGFYEDVLEEARDAMRQEMEHHENWKHP